MPPVATVVDSGMCLFPGQLGIAGWEGGGDIHQSEDIIFVRFLSQDARTSSCLGRIRMGARCCVKLRLVSG